MNISFMDNRIIKIIFLFGLIVFVNSCKYPITNEPELVLQAPILAYPANNAVDISTPPIVRWNTSIGATKYTVQVSTDSTFSTYTYNQSDVTDTTQLVTGLNNLVRYFWRVNAANSSGTSDWSAPVWSFTTAGAIPNVPTLLLPSNNSIDISRSPILKWNASIGATSYTLQVSSNSLFSNFVFNQSGLTNTSQQVSGLNDYENYYWRVSATNNYGTSSWSTPAWSFTTAYAIPDSPSLLSPTDNSIEISTSPIFSWNSSSNATSYTLQISYDASFANLVHNQSGIRNTNQQVTGLNNLTTFYWRVSATNGNGTSGWSIPAWSFKTKAAVLSAPLLSLPTNNANSISTSPFFVWSASPGATNYTLQISTSNSFLILAYSKSEIIGTNLPITGLNPLTTYFWRVRAANSNGTSDWSTPVWSFTTGGSPIIPPVLTSPANNEFNVSVNPTLTWDASAGAISYTLQVSTNSSFSNFVFNQSGLLNTSRQLSGLSYLTKHYWRVSATNNSGTSGWSTPVWSFTTTDACQGGTVIYAGKLYHTVQVGSQCWLKENLDVGLRINGSQNQTNNGIIEKYCYDNNNVNCDTFGGLYQWNEAMLYSKAQGAKGICPEGFHIPTITELEILRNTVNGNSNALKAVGEGTAAGAGTNTSGFSALLSGYAYSSNSGVGFTASGFTTYFWSSTEADLIYSYYLNLYFNQSFIQSYYDRKESGFSVRCIKD